MRINRFVAQSTGLSRRGADELIAKGEISLNGVPATIGSIVKPGDTVKWKDKTLRLPAQTTTILLHKPVGYVCSRAGQGSRTIYDLLPPGLHSSKPVGRLDKDSSGLLLLTTDGDLAHSLTHPSQQKEKVYEVVLNKALAPADFEKITKMGVALEDGLSKFKLESLDDRSYKWKVTMSEGRNRQIRRTFSALGYRVAKLHRTQFGEYKLSDVIPGDFIKI